MPPKKKKAAAARASESVPYVKDFKPPSAAATAAAVGTFPCTRSADDRQGMLTEALAGGFEPPSFLAADGPGQQNNLDEVLAQLNDESLYGVSAAPAPADAKNASRGTKRAKVAAPKPAWDPLAPPRDEQDWLAQVCEEGQTFEQYISMISTRSGRFQSRHADPKKQKITNSSLQILLMELQLTMMTQMLMVNQLV